jgi:hypothetical protein
MLERLCRLNSLASLALTANAAIFTVTPSSIGNVDILSPGSTDFSPLVGRALPDGVLQGGMIPALTVAVIVRNRSSTTVLHYVVKFVVQKPGYPAITNFVGQDFRRDKVSDNVVALGPGAVRMNTALSEWADPASRAYSVADSKTLQAQLTTLMATLDGAAITASLDSVFFENGQLAGPDSANWASRLKAEASARATLISQLRLPAHSTDEDLNAFLDGVIGERPTIARDFGYIKRHEIALRMKGVLRQGRILFNQAVDSLLPYPEPVAAGSIVTQ